MLVWQIGAVSAVLRLGRESGLDWGPSIPRFAPATILSIYDLIFTSLRGISIISIVRRTRSACKIHCAVGLGESMLHRNLCSTTLDLELILAHSISFMDVLSTVAQPSLSLIMLTTKEHWPQRFYGCSVFCSLSPLELLSCLQGRVGNQGTYTDTCFYFF